MKRLAIAGCGKLGGIVVEAAIRGLLSDYEIVGVYSSTAAKAQALAERVTANGGRSDVADTFASLLAMRPDILVEAASPAAMREWALPALANGTSVVSLSIGALADDAFYEEVQKTARQHGARVYIVSGATGGFDVLQTATLMGGATAQF